MSEAIPDPDHPFAEVNDKPIESDTPGIFFAGLALLLPLIGGIMHFFVTSESPGFWLSASVVGVTALLVSIDASLLPKTDPNGEPRQNAGLLFLACCLVWIVAYPAAFFTRKRFGGPNLGVVSLVIAAFFLAAPFLSAFLVPPGLPGCSSAEVVGVLDDLIRSQQTGATVQSIDSHAETAYDPVAQTRHGTCLVHTANGDITLNYLVEWTNRDNGTFQVRILPSELPTCDSPDVTSLLGRVIRNSLQGPIILSIDGHSQTHYDVDEQVRYGECVVHTDSGDLPIQFIVRWQDEEKGLFEVQIPPADLPNCDSDEVIRILQDVIPLNLTDEVVQSITAHQEIKYDKAKQIRFGQCSVATNAGTQTIKFLVEWMNSDRSRFRVRIPPEQLPACDAHEVMALLDQIVGNAFVEVDVTSIDGHREISFDVENQVRQGACVVHSASGDQPLGFTVTWIDRQLGYFQVNLLPVPNAPGQ